VRVDTTNGILEEHDAVGTLPSGEEFRFRVAVVVTVADGRIASLNEYFDTAQGPRAKLAAAAQAS
jgi:ketosteroid isomerase-like protein